MDRMMLFCSLAFVAGAAVSWVISKIVNSEEKMEMQSKIELDLLKESFQNYQQASSTYFIKTTQLVEEIQYRVHHLQELLFAAKQTLTEDIGPTEESAEPRADYSVAKAVLDRAQSAELGIQHFKKGV
jgi:uncharacterized membrane-anchored protein YhcB (DUF1043 family)